MKIELGTIALILGVVGFYVKLLLAQRRKTREWEIERQRAANRKKSKKLLAGIADKPPVFGTFSHRKRDWAIGAAGFALMAFGLMVFRGWIPSAQYQSSWWFPVMAGTYLFAWFFN